VAAWVMRRLTLQVLVSAAICAPLMAQDSGAPISIGNVGTLARGVRIAVRPADTVVVYVRYDGLERACDVAVGDAEQWGESVLALVSSMPASGAVPRTIGAPLASNCDLRATVGRADVPRYTMRLVLDAGVAEVGLSQASMREVGRLVIGAATLAEAATWTQLRRALTLGAGASFVMPSAALGVRPPNAYYEFEVDVPASRIPMSGANPVYPAELVAQRVAGEVYTRFVVDTSGFIDPESILIIASPHEAFTAAVRRALPTFTFRAALARGNKVRQVVQMPFQFNPPRTPSPAPSQPPGETYFDFQVDRAVRATGGSGSPRYPETLRSRAVEGEVLARFVVDTTGRVVEGTFAVLRASHPEFEEAVRIAIPQLVFTPAMKDGRNVRQLVQQPFIFKLERDQ
jgi:TonB family protein